MPTGAYRWCRCRRSPSLSLSSFVLVAIEQNKKEGLLRNLIQHSSNNHRTAALMKV